MKRIVVDILMGIAIVLEFASLPILAHEILGLALLFLIVLHLNYNKNYFKAINKGKYTLKRSMDLIINIALLISLLLTIISGICTAQKSLKNLAVGKYKISHIHKYSSIVSLVLLVVHLFVNRKRLAGHVKRLQ